MEDMTPMQSIPGAPNSHGHVSATSIMDMRKERFKCLYHEFDFVDDQGEGKGEFIFPLVLHPDTSGMAHIIGMIDRTIGWLKSRGEDVSFCRHEDVAREFKEQ